MAQQVQQRNPVQAAATPDVGETSAPKANRSPNLACWERSDEPSELLSISPIVHLSVTLQLQIAVAHVYLEEHPVPDLTEKLRSRGFTTESFFQALENLAAQYAWQPPVRWVTESSTLEEWRETVSAVFPHYARCDIANRSYDENDRQHRRLFFQLLEIKTGSMADPVNARVIAEAATGKSAAPVCTHIRNIIGFPNDAPISIEDHVLAWNDGTVVRLAQGIYDERDFSSLKILADALEDAGCVNDRVLGSLRDATPKCRGYYVLDIILRKR